MSKPSPAPGQVWKYSSHGSEVFGVVAGQNADGSWLLYSFSCWEHGKCFLGNRGRENLFATSDFANAEYIGLIANNKADEVSP